MNSILYYTSRSIIKSLEHMAIIAGARYGHSMDFNRGLTAWGEVAVSRFHTNRAGNTAVGFPGLLS
jgi:hypothetical protein